MTELNKMLHLAIPEYARPGKPACGIDSEVAIFHVREKVREVNCQWCIIWWMSNQTRYPTNIVRRILDSDGYDFHATHWVDPAEEHPACGVSNKRESYLWVDEENLKASVSCVHCRDLLDGRAAPDDYIQADAEFWDRLRRTVHESIMSEVLNETRDEPPPPKTNDRIVNMKFDNELWTKSITQVFAKGFSEELLDSAMDFMDQFFSKSEDEKVEPTEGRVHYKKAGYQEAVCGWDRSQGTRSGERITFLTSQVDCKKCLGKMGHIG